MLNQHIQQLTNDDDDDDDVLCKTIHSIQFY